MMGVICESSIELLVNNHDFFSFNVLIRQIVLLIPASATQLNDTTCLKPHEKGNGTGDVTRGKAGYLGWSLFTDMCQILNKQKYCYKSVKRSKITMMS